MPDPHESQAACCSPGCRDAQTTIKDLKGQITDLMELADCKDEDNEALGLKMDDMKADWENETAHLKAELASKEEQLKALRNIVIEKDAAYESLQEGHEAQARTVASLQEEKTVLYRKVKLMGQRLTDASTVTGRTTYQDPAIRHDCLLRVQAKGAIGIATPHRSLGPGQRESFTLQTEVYAACDRWIALQVNPLYGAMGLRLTQPAVRLFRHHMGVVDVELHNTSADHAI